MLRVTVAAAALLLIAAPPTPAAAGTTRVAKSSAGSLRVGMRIVPKGQAIRRPAARLSRIGAGSN